MDKVKIKPFAVVIAIVILLAQFAFVFGGSKPKTNVFAVETTDIAVDETNFPDYSFRNYIKEQFGDTLSADEIASTTAINVYDKYISDLTGIEYFTELTELTCSDNNLTSLDVRKNTALTYLYCANNSLTSLGVSKNTNLKELTCSYNNLKSLDVRNNINLINLYCDFNEITALDVSKNINLEILLCQDNQIKVLDLSANEKLTSIACMNNQLTSLDLTNTAIDEAGNINCYDNSAEVQYDMNNQIKLSDLEGNFDATKIVDGTLTNATITDGVMTITDITQPVTYDYKVCDLETETFKIIPFELKIDETNFPDEKFIDYLTEEFDDDKDGSLSASEINIVNIIDVTNKGITNLTGIEYFTELTKLTCTNNRITSLDLSYNTNLETLDCKNNNLTSLDVSNCTKLTDLYCGNNNLSHLDLTGIPIGTYSLDFSGNVRPVSSGEGEILLADLGIDKEKVSNVSGAIFDEVNGKFTNVVANTNIEYFYACGIDSVNLECTLKPLDGIIIDETNFPDANFRNYLKNGAEHFEFSGFGDTLSADEIASTTEILVSNMNISDLTGIEYFTELTELTCSDNNLTSLDVRKNTKLIELNCNDNSLTSLDVSKNTKLIELNCNDNSLTSLDLSKNTALTYLYCANNSLTSLGVSKNTNLTQLTCSYNNLKSLDVRNNINLINLYCDFNELTALDVSKNTNLGSLLCQENQIKVLDLSANEKLISIACMNNHLTSLDLTNTAIDGAGNINCYDNSAEVQYDMNNQIKLSDLEGNFDATKIVDGTLTNATITDGVMTITDITQPVTYDYKVCDLETETFKIIPFELKIDETNFPDEKFIDYLTEEFDYDKDGSLSASEINIVNIIDVTNKGITNLTGIEYFTELTKLDCSDNSLTSLDVSKNTKLNALYCSGNLLTSLDFKNNTLLKQINCSNNTLTSLDVTALPNLNTLLCSDNKLASLDLKNNTLLKQINCSNNTLTSLDVTALPNLTTLLCNDNNLTILNINNNTKLTKLNCLSNNLTSLYVGNNTVLEDLQHDNILILEEKVEYEITEGDNQKVEIGTDGTLSFTSNGDFEKFEALIFNDKLVDTSNYTAVKGSTKITLNADYVKSLPLGAKTFTLEFFDGYSTAKLEIIPQAIVGDDTIEDTADKPTVQDKPTTEDTDKPVIDDTENPDTSNSSNLVFLSILALISVAGAYGTKKKISKKI